MLEIQCRRCQQLSTADDEDSLVAQVRAHDRDHGGAHGTHVPDREHILAHLDWWAPVRRRDVELEVDPVT